MFARKAMRPSGIQNTKTFVAKKLQKQVDQGEKNILP
jgi:hypothetical protein